MRLFHQFIYISHAGMIYVDDMFFMQDGCVMPLTASLLSLFCQAIQIPLSWKRCELSSEVKWIGWYINVATGVIMLPDDKKSIQKTDGTVHGSCRVGHLAVSSHACLVAFAVQ